MRPVAPRRRIAMKGPPRPADLAADGARPPALRRRRPAEELLRGGWYDSCRCPGALPTLVASMESGCLLEFEICDTGFDPRGHGLGMLLGRGLRAGGEPYYLVEAITADTPELSSRPGCAALCRLPTSWPSALARRRTWTSRARCATSCRWRWSEWCPRRRLCGAGAAPSSSSSSVGEMRVDALLLLLPRPRLLRGRVWMQFLCAMLQSLRCGVCARSRRSSWAAALRGGAMAGPERCPRWPCSRPFRPCPHEWRRSPGMMLLWVVARRRRWPGVRVRPGPSARSPQRQARGVPRARSSQSESGSLPAMALWRHAVPRGGSFASTPVRPTWWRLPTPRAMGWAITASAVGRRRGGRGGRRGRGTGEAAPSPRRPPLLRAHGQALMRSFFGQPRASRAPHHERSATRWSARTWFWCRAWQRSRDCCRARLLGRDSPRRRSRGVSQRSTCPSWSAFWRGRSLRLGRALRRSASAGRCARCSTVSSEATPWGP